MTCFLQKIKLMTSFLSQTAFAAAGAEAFAMFLDVSLLVTEKTKLDIIIKNIWVRNLNRFSYNIHAIMRLAFKISDIFSKIKDKNALDNPSESWW